MHVTVVQLIGRLCYYRSCFRHMHMPEYSFCADQDIALVERTAATFNSPYKQGRVVLEDREPQQCVLLRAGGHMSVLDMEQGHPRAPYCSRSHHLESPCVDLVRSCIGAALCSKAKKSDV